MKNEHMYDSLHRTENKHLRDLTHLKTDFEMTTSFLCLLRAQCRKIDMPVSSYRIYFPIPLL